MVARDKAASEGKGGGEESWGWALPACFGALSVHSSQCRLSLSASLRPRAPVCLKAIPSSNSSHFIALTVSDKQG